MPNRNPNIAALKAGYLFPEIARRRREFAAAHPDAKIISLGVGNTTEPILPHTCEGLAEGARRLGKAKTYSGYTDEGFEELRLRISAVFYKNKFNIDEIFISDGAKCDIGRLQLLFGSGVSVAVQDPSYPVYVDGSVLSGAASACTGETYGGIFYMPCTAENNYSPDLTNVPHNSLIYFCSPNNPTGACATREYLKKLVDFAQKSGSIIIYDAAYSEYIRDSAFPKSIYEIAGSELCAIEVNSFSKPAGFTGVRLGWSVVPKALKFSGGESVNTDWARINSTIFNGASNIAQWGAIAALDDEGQKEIKELTDYYLENAKLIRTALKKKNISCIGGDNSPYIWAHFPGKDSWAVFNELLEKCNIVTTPGVGFGISGQSFIRFSAFGHRHDIEEACTRLERF
ncbi:MAG: LL-diaminopimelate aminotransferase [Spirochaetaceae bacterium]|jgi:LL-diaminopimelate aminotransferase|nr:LL-diaminopimelate aminotransferase [Spirochaetaceae bacterium]